MPEIPQLCNACHQTSNNIQGPLMMTRDGRFHPDCLGHAAAPDPRVHDSLQAPSMALPRSRSNLDLLAHVSELRLPPLRPVLHAAQSNDDRPHLPQSFSFQALLDAASILHTAPELIRAPVITRTGREAGDIIEALRLHKDRALQVIYQGEEGYDAGAPSRQALTRTYETLIKPDLGLFAPTSEGTLRVRPAMNRAWNCEDVGRVLGRIATLDMGIGHDIEPLFFSKTNLAFQYNMKHQMQLDLVSSLNSLAESEQSRDILIDFLQNVEPGVFTVEPHLSYINTLDLSELKSLAEDYIPYFQVAKGMQDAGMSPFLNAEALLDAICGSTDLRAALLENLSLSNDISSVPAHVREYFLNLIKTMISAEPDEDKLKNLCFNLTGSNILGSSNKPLPVLVSGVELSEPVVFHSCPKQLDLNLGALSKLLPSSATAQDEYNLLYSFLLDGKKMTHYNMF